MIVYEHQISDVHYDRDFGNVEARVTFLAKTQAGQPPHRVSVMTHVPARDADQPLRTRLVDDAAVLVNRLLPQARASRAA